MHSAVDDMYRYVCSDLCGLSYVEAWALTVSAGRCMRFVEACVM